MSFFRNVGSQQIAVFAWDVANQTEKTGDAANITAYLSKDGAALAQTNDVNPTELNATNAPGIYLFNMTQAETNAERLILFAKSSTTDVKIEPVIIHTTQNWQQNGAAALVDSVWDEVLTGATHNVPTSAGRRLRQLASAITLDGTFDSATATTGVLDNDASDDDKAYVSSILVVATGTGAGQSRLIADYDGSTHTAYINRAWTVIPNSSSEYIIIANEVWGIAERGLVQSATASTATLPSDMSAVNDLYNEDILIIRSGTGANQTRRIQDYDGSTRTVTLASDWQVIPDTDSVFAIVSSGQSIVGKVTQDALDDIWGNASRTLTQSAASVAAAVDGEQITLVRGTTWEFSLTGLGNLTNYDSIFFSAKRRFDYDDDDALLRVRDAVSGLERFNGATPTADTNGTITIDDAANGDITITVEAIETKNAPLVEDFYYDVKGIDDDGQVNVLSRGIKQFDVVGDVTNAITS